MSVLVLFTFSSTWRYDLEDPDDLTLRSSLEKADKQRADIAVG
jgi:hypothetical protein